MEESEVMSALSPGPSLLCKLGSIIVHAEELASPGGHPFDKHALDSLLADSSVVQWLAAMRFMSMLPVKRG